MRNSTRHHHFQKGFTLVELAIVLVIIGLIIGGITIGTDMIRSATLNRTIAQANEYEIAINAFRLQYNGLPGDISNASSYWPSCSTPATNCDGDDNAEITPGNENVRAWQQLNDSEILSLSLSNSDVGVDMAPGVNIPAYDSSTTSGYAFRQSSYPDAGAKAIEIGDMFDEVAAETNFSYPVFNPLDAYNIDRKKDDGNAITGKVRGSTRGGTSCRDVNGAYNLTTDITACNLFFHY